MPLTRKRSNRKLKKTRRLVGGGKGGHKPGMGQTKKAKEAAAAAAAAAGGATGNGAGAAAAPASETAAERCERVSREVCAGKEASWETVVPSQRTTHLVRMLRDNGYDKKDGQYKITVAYLPREGDLTHRPDEIIESTVILGRDFLKNPGEPKAKIACPHLLKPGAAVLLKMGEGRMFGYSSVAGYVGRFQVKENVARTYMDLAAVIPPDIEKKWISEGKLLTRSRW